MTKETFKSEISKAIEAVGYLPFPIKLPEAMLIFYKKIGDNLILTLGIERSNLIKDSFTGSYYLSPLFSWGYTPPTMPEKAYKRIGEFLKKEERQILLSAEFNQKGVKDAWWQGFTNESIEKFVRAIDLTEIKFLSQDNLQKAVVTNSDFREDKELLNLIIDEAANNGTMVSEYKDYYELVKSVIKKNKEKYSIWDSKNGIEFLSQNAWALKNL